MRYGVLLPNMGEGCDARGLAGLAAAAEEAGWDGVFVWDSVYIPGEGATYDPWIALAAIALSTHRGEPPPVRREDQGVWPSALSPRPSL